MFDEPSLLISLYVKHSQQERNLLQLQTGGSLN